MPIVRLTGKPPEAVSRTGSSTGSAACSSSAFSSDRPVPPTTSAGRGSGRGVAVSAYKMMVWIEGLGLARTEDLALLAARLAAPLVLPVPVDEAVAVGDGVTCCPSEPALFPFCPFPGAAEDPDWPLQLPVVQELLFPFSPSFPSCTGSVGTPSPTSSPTFWPNAPLTAINIIKEHKRKTAKISRLICLSIKFTPGSFR